MWDSSFLTMANGRIRSIHYWTLTDQICFFGNILPLQIVKSNKEEIKTTSLKLSNQKPRVRLQVDGHKKLPSLDNSNLLVVAETITFQTIGILYHLGTKSKTALPVIGR